MLFSQAYGNRRVDSSMITYSMQGKSKFHMQSRFLYKKQNLHTTKAFCMHEGQISE